MRVLPLLVVLALAPPSLAITQQPSLRLERGQRVRVTAPDLGMDKREQTFQQLRGDTLVFTSLHCPLEEVTRLDVYQGRRGHFWLGAAIGAGVGAIAGAVTGVAACESDWWCSDEKELVGLAGAGVGIFAGGLLGGGIGALIKSDRWEELPLDRVRVSLGPAGRGLKIGARLTF